MNKIYTNEEIEELSKYLGFKYSSLFCAYICHDYDIQYETSSEFVLNERENYKPKIEEIRELGNMDNSLSDSSEKNVIEAIALSKELNINYLMSKFGDKIDENTAKRLVEFGYTNGNCFSLANMLCDLFPNDCEIKLFSTKNYKHQCVKVKDKYYDVFGCSTEIQMKEFVATIGGTTPDKCDIQSFDPPKLPDWRENSIDSIIIDYYKRNIIKEKKDDEPIK